LTKLNGIISLLRSSQTSRSWFNRQGYSTNAHRS